MLKQLFIPDFPVGAQRVGESLSILDKDGWVTYFVGGDNYFSHPQEDIRSRRFALASLMENGHVRARDLEQPPLCIAHRTLMNWIKQNRKAGSSSFFHIPDPVKPRVMTAHTSAQCASLLAQGIRPSVVARQVGIHESTLRKAVQRGAVVPLAVSIAQDSAQGAPVLSTKSERSRADAEAAEAMGTACTRADERVQAAMGLAQCASTRFEPGCDVQMAGLLTGLPALCANGLFSGLDKHLRE